MPIPIANIAIEFPTNVIKAVRCHSPSTLVDTGRLLLDHYTNPIMIFDLVAFGDIQILAETIETSRFSPFDPPKHPTKGRIVLNVYPVDMYNDRTQFIENNHTDPQILFLYSYKTNRWEFLDHSTPPPSVWIDLTEWFWDEHRQIGCKPRCLLTPRLLFLSSSDSPK